MIGVIHRFPIDEGFQRLTNRKEALAERLRGRPQFKDPHVGTFQGVSLSQKIDEELERFYSPPTPVQLITRVFRRVRRAQ